MRGRRFVAGFILVLLGSCSSAASAPTALRISQAPDDPSRPYVITAIDYHFHDAHPSRPIDRSRAVEFTNQGRNRHNVTILGTSFTRDVRPLQLFVIPTIGSILPSPGRYRFICRYHLDRGMQGVLLVV